MAVRLLPNRRGRLPGLVGVCLVAVLSLSANRLPADPPKAPPKKAEAAAPPSGVIRPEVWRQAATGPLQEGEIDRMVSAELRRAGIKPAPRTTDEQFLRRVWLDL